MYNSSYTRPKVAMKAQDIRRSKGKGCGYYLRIIFFFSSLIQSLIIVSLVLFLVYGQPEKSADEKRVAELEQIFNKLSMDNTNLRKDNVNLNATLKIKIDEKDAAYKKVTKLTADLDAAKGNNTKHLQALAICNSNKTPLLRSISPCPQSGASSEQTRYLQTLLEQQKSLYAIVQANFSQTVQNLKFNLNNVIKDKNMHEMAMITLKKESEDLSSELKLYKKKCKEDFVTLLQGIQVVTTAFLTKIDSLFPNSFTFHLTCANQQEQMRNIHANCTNLSRQVEDKFQNYLNMVGEKVSTLQAESSRLEVENTRLKSNGEKCDKEHTQVAEQCTKTLQEQQQTHDTKVEQLLKDYKELLQEKQMLQATCLPKPPVPKPSGNEWPFAQQRPNFAGTNTGFQSKPSNSQPPKVR
ncbi:plasmalemma vesicle associated protein b [Silurus meridionalis]|uniref:Plasmalemma vesicle-associated protein n=1 Tax=Silurus meridionalis TaxID=175797 RepID=A0A8T0B9A7_SILME|nr:plasmalemma vesicle associated protein b [Silurus meridionalis]KAF7703461.1 hypothetical protein HF521_022468 [Silurus meridionalis]